MQIILNIRFIMFSLILNNPKTTHIIYVSGLILREYLLTLHRGYIVRLHFDSFQHLLCQTKESYSWPRK